ncbi:hypothetical protein A8L33_03940 [Microbacterium aurantiacum]|nr:hypothetical protein A8L33_03940 [Microbacterium chocolatum]
MMAADGGGDLSGPQSDALQRLLSRMPAGRWPHVEIPPGWIDLVLELDDVLARIEPDYRLLQAAKRNGDLVYRAVTDGGTPYPFDERIRSAQFRARITCEVCGEAGQPRTRSRTVLCDLHWKPLTTGELLFALTAGGPADTFTDESDQTAVEYEAASAAADRARNALHFAAAEVAELLNICEEDVYSMFVRGEVAGADRDGLVVYPRWQFTEAGALLPGLPLVLKSARDIDSGTFQAVMETADEDLNGLSPARWLAEGRSVGVVVELLRYLRRLP